MKVDLTGVCIPEDRQASQHANDVRNIRTANPIFTGDTYHPRCMTDKLMPQLFAHRVSRLPFKFTWNATETWYSKLQEVCNIVLKMHTVPSH